MKRLLVLLVLPGITVSGLAAVAEAPSADAVMFTCHPVSKTSTAATYTCSGDGIRFRAYVDCRRVSSTYTYRSFGPVRPSGGKSTAVCSQVKGDYRTGQGFKLV